MSALAKSIAMACLCLGAASLLAPDIALAQRHVRGGAKTSVHAGGGAAAPTGAGANASVRANSATVKRGGNTVNRGGNTVIAGNNVNRNVNINVDNDHHGWDWDDDYHPVARGVAFGAAAAVPAAAIGSMVRTLPPACPLYPYPGYTYYYCGGVYYQPQYQGTQITYVVVNAPG